VGHFYSPIPNPGDVADGLAIAGGVFPGVDLNEKTQHHLLQRMTETYPQLRFPETRAPGRRYFYRNGSFGALDAVALAAIARHYAPKRVIEVGSGHSSAALLDLRDDGILEGCAFTFIDPDFSRLRELMSETDPERVTMLAKKVQDVSFDVFRQLGPGDILLIDSSHVAKIGSDVNFIVFHTGARARSYRPFSRRFRPV